MSHSVPVGSDARALGQSLLHIAACMSSAYLLNAAQYWNIIIKCLRTWRSTLASTKLEEMTVWSVLDITVTPKDLIK